MQNAKIQKSRSESINPEKSKFEENLAPSIALLRLSKADPTWLSAAILKTAMTS